MRRKMTLALVMIPVLSSLTACGRSTCNLCGNEKSGRSHKTAVFGQEIMICNDCYSDLKIRDVFK